MSSVSRILITQSVLANIGGSEVQAYELARHFRALGADVTLYAWCADSPMRDILEREGFRIVLRGQEEAGMLHIRDFDLVWVQHEVIPERMIEELGDPVGDGCRFVFSHMSPFLELYMEFPYIRGLERDIASMSVFNSQETRDAQLPFLPGDDRTMVSPNSAPSEYAALTHDGADSPRRILIVSNHAPGEVAEAAALLAGEGRQVDYLREVAGEENGARITSAALLSGYDCVVTIGKTVQYCLTAGIPVYVYDHFGGPGYLDDANWRTSDRHNFSGRMRPYSKYLSEARTQALPDRLDPETLARDIVERYAQAAAWQHANLDMLRNRYGIGPVMRRLLSAIDDGGFVRRRLSRETVEYVLQTQRTYADFTAQRRAFVNLDNGFYAQSIQVFASETGEFTADGLVQVLPLERRSRLYLPGAGRDRIRIDYGEYPCVVEDLTVRGVDARNLVIETNATDRIGDAYLFVGNDPQVRLWISGERSDDIVVECTVRSLTASPQVTHAHADRFMEQATTITVLQRDIDRIQQSKWWRLGERLRSLLAIVRR